MREVYVAFNYTQMLVEEKTKEAIAEVKEPFLKSVLIKSVYDDVLKELIPKNKVITNSQLCVFQRLHKFHSNYKHLQIIPNEDKTISSIPLQSLKTTIRIEDVINLYNYNDYSCCGINYLGSIQVHKVMNSTVIARLKSINVVDIFKELDSYIFTQYLVDFVIRYANILPKTAGYPDYKTEYSLEEVITDLVLKLKTSDMNERYLSLRATTGTSRYNEMVFTEEKINSYFKNSFDSQNFFHAYLMTSKIFTKTNSFININSGNKVTEFEFKVIYSEILDNILEFLKVLKT